MYQIADVLARIDTHLAPVLVFTLIGWVSGFVQISEALRLGRRDKIPAAPIAMTGFLLAHDSTYAAHYSLWFGVVGHWYFKMFWIGMLGAVVIELILVGQYLAYAPREIAPRLPRSAFAAIYLMGQTFMFAVLWWIQSVLDDPLLLVTLGMTQIAAVIFLVPWILTRGNARGQSRAFAWATLLGPGSLALGLFPALSDTFNTWQFYAVAGCVTTMAVTYCVLLERYRRGDPERNSDRRASIARSNHKAAATAAGEQDLGN
jgi:uncharacterized membrane protein